MNDVIEKIDTLYARFDAITDEIVAYSKGRHVHKLVDEACEVVADMREAAIEALKGEKKGSGGR